MDDPADLLALPRSVLLALWLGAPPAERRRAAVAVEGDDEPHVVTGAPALVPDGGTLDDLLLAWNRPGRRSAAVLPVPGDVSGLPPAVADLAVDAGECVLVHADGQPWCAVPDVMEFGSSYEPGHLVTWTVQPVPDWRVTLPGAVGTVSEAETSLRHALREATEALAGLDVARWRPDAAAALGALRSEGDPAWPLPSGLAPRAVRVLVSALRLRAIVSLATDDDGGAINLWQADQRSAALRHIDHAARRAVCAATAAAWGEPGSGT